MTIEQKISENRTYLIGIAILSIMLFHQGWIWGWNPFFAFFHFFGNWGVDVFFFVSGFGLYYSLKKDNRLIPFYYRRIIRILPLCLACGLMRYLIDHILPVGIGGYPTGEHSVSSNWMTILSWDKWFIPVILIYYLVMPWLYKAIGKYGYMALCVAYIIALAGIWSETFNLYTLRFPSFCMGVVIAAGLFKETRLVRYGGYMMIFLAVVYRILIMTDSPWVHDDSYTYILLSFGIVMLVSVIIRFLPSKSVKGNNEFVTICMNSFSFMGKHTLEIYLVHEFIYRYTYRFLIDTSIPLFLQLIIGMVSSVAIATLIAFFVNNIMRYAR